MRRNAGTLHRAVGRSLPRRGSITDEDWRFRHHAVLAGLLVAMALALVVGLVRLPQDRMHVLAEMVPVCLAAAVGVLGRSKVLREGAVTLAILLCCGLLVHFTGGLVESHFSYFVMLPLIALYHDWRPFALAVLYVAVEHAVMGMVDPTGLYNHPAATGPGQVGRGARRVPHRALRWS